MVVEVKLSKPVPSEGTEISTLQIREPIGEDIAACGYPFRIYLSSDTDVDAKKEQEAKIDTVVLTKLAAKLANVPPSTIKRLPVKDYQKVVDAVMGFFE
nr:MAG TPA: tail assembly chaperone [Caudoviricetes sp.]